MLLFTLFGEFQQETRLDTPRVHPSQYRRSRNVLH